jgi:hypothetical protein
MFKRLVTVREKIGSLATMHPREVMYGISLGVILGIGLALTPNIAHALTDTERYDSGYNHGASDANNGLARFCDANDHTDAYCQGYNAGYDSPPDTSYWTLYVYVINIPDQTTPIIVHVYNKDGNDLYSTLNNSGYHAYFTMSDDNYPEGKAYTVCITPTNPGVFNSNCETFSHSRGDGIVQVVPG